MPRESARDKATRYLAEGRGVLTRVDRTTVVAKVRGEGATYATVWDRWGWRCDCPHTARTTDCSHRLAVKRVVSVDVDRPHR